MAEQIDWQSLDDKAFVERAEKEIWLSSFAANNPRSPAHEQVRRAHDESGRRGKPWLYCRAWNRAFISCGYEPDALDREMATARYWRERAEPA